MKIRVDSIGVKKKKKKNLARRKIVVSKHQSLYQLPSSEVCAKDRSTNFPKMMKNGFQLNSLVSIGNYLLLSTR